ncbi:hypothetical protein [Pseudomonas mosselii]|nr:hypothetical protein [Pseudomonas mosselii]MCU9527542.1 hypothetical protein [Pseudomonas mosselii]MCU9534855.1 hypothetical protein [Pseudomonas mosselii]MCU9542789.1 hypothetical protein [Pseudomonas mosselii]MCU9546695.1 hypothetical protein [Pseudomonas mosselii]
MLNFVTGQRPGEPGLLSTVKHLAFDIRSLAGNGDSAGRGKI